MDAVYPGNLETFTRCFTYRHYGIAAALIMLISMAASSIGTQSAVQPLEDALYRHPVRRRMLAEIGAVIGSRSAVTATAAYMLLMLATGLSFALNTYFNIYAWGLNTTQISVLTGSSFISATFALFISPSLAQRFDKKRGVVGVTVMLLLLLPLPLAVSLVGLMPTAASGSLLPLLFAFNVVIVTLFVIAPTLLSSMLADVVEEIEARTGQRDEGVIFALNTFVAKSASGLGVFASTTILTLARFPAQARAGLVDPAVIGRLAGFYIASVMLLYTGSLLCISLYRITREQHASNLRLIAQRRAMSSATA